MQDYAQMWLVLGLDLKAHDGLLSIPGGAYRSILLSQKGHPGGMKHFDFLMSEAPVEAELERAGAATLRLETDYSQEDAGQLKTRIEAFIERINKQ